MSALEEHKKWKGKIEVISRVAIKDVEALTLAYTPGVAEPCKEIARDPELSYTYTRRSNLVAVITDGSAVLGLGNIGGLAGMPVMEGKCALFKEFADVDAFPICLKNQDVESIVNTIVNISDSFGGINLEDISAPRCFEVERKLKERLSIPVFHDDQHGTAIVVAAALKNALKLVKKSYKQIKIAIIGAGAAGTAIAKLLLEYKPKEVIMCDRKGILYKGAEWMNDAMRELAKITNISNLKGGVNEALKGADVVIGVSGANTITVDMVREMNEKSIVFAMSNPIPEIMPEDAIIGGAYIVGTGRSDYNNQINNVLVFPGLFKGCLKARAVEITQQIKLACVDAIADLVSNEDLNINYIIPKPFDKRVAIAVAEAVYKQAIKEKE